MSVARALPQRGLPLVGAWCFLDRFGPQVTTMRVEPHPHVGLQTVTWPLAGQVRHRDSTGSDVRVCRGTLNLMTSGAGIAHSEYSVLPSAVLDDPDAAETMLDALQFWVALPETRRHGPAGFEQHADLPQVSLPAESPSADTATATVVLGEFAGARSPATTHTPIVGAEIRIPARSRVQIPLNPDWEYAIVAVSGSTEVAADPADPRTVTDLDLLYLGIHRESVVVHAETEAVLFLLGGAPFGEEIVMWWNFVTRSHDEIVEARTDWEATAARFGQVVGHGSERIPAPPLPTVRLTRRRRRL